MVVTPGRVLGDRYRLDEKIAVGGMGDVWRAEDTVLGRPVAVKVLRAEHAADPSFVERFRGEARHAAGLAHPGIAAVHDYGETDDEGTTLAYLVMELVPGEPLSALLARSAPLTVERTLDLMADAAEALQAAHDAGVIHRDVKPSNILVRPEWISGSTGGIALTDFGIARATNDPNHLTKSGLVLGTAYYLSPEQASGKTVTPASDLYALGVVAYECLTGERPFTGDSAVQVAVAHMRDDPPPLPDSVPEPVRNLVSRLLAKDPADRPASAADLAATARAVRGGTAGAEASPATRVLTTPVPVAAVADPSTEMVGTDTGRKRPRWRSNAYPDQQKIRGLLLIVGLVVIVLGAILLSLVGGGDQPAKSSSGRNPSPTGPSAVSVREAAFLARPYDSVRADLRSLGLRVERRDLASTATTGSVVGVDPHGRLPAGTSVTVTVAAPLTVGPPEKPAGKGADKGHGKGHKPKEDHGHD